MTTPEATLSLIISILSQTNQQLLKTVGDEDELIEIHATLAGYISHLGEIAELANMAQKKLNFLIEIV